MIKCFYQTRGNPYENPVFFSNSALGLRYRATRYRNIFRGTLCKFANRNKNELFAARRRYGACLSFYSRLFHEIRLSKH